MTLGYNPLDPMCKSEYLTYTMPIDTLIQCTPIPPATPTLPGGKGNSPQLNPQLKEDKFYKFDGKDDGNITKWEKIKAFAKGSTYNIGKALFCDDKGFSLKKTALTLAGGAAIGLLGPVGLAVAGGIGLAAGLTKFVKACKSSNTAATDAEARQVYENLGESTTTIGLSLFGGFKGLKFLRKNAKFAKANPAMDISKWTKLHKWKIL